jgi:hypothetical protein
MNHLPFHAFGLCILFLAATANAQVTVEQIAANPKLWPREIKLTQAVPLQLYQNGRLTGSIQGNPGMALHVTKVEPARLIVEIAGAAAAVAPGATDLLTRVDVSSNASASSPAAQSSSTTLPVAPASAQPATTPAPSHLDTFRTGWKMPRGKWVVASDTEIEQNDNKDGVSNAYKAFPQSGKMEYRLKEKYFGGKSACTTIYIMCDDGEKTERGNGYLIADALNEKGHAEITVLKVTNDKTKEMKKLASSPVNGQWIDLLITFDSDTGNLEVTRNGKVLGSWTDPDPIKEGKDFSIGTCMTKAGFRDIQVSQGR